MSVPASQWPALLEIATAAAHSAAECHRAAPQDLQARSKGHPSDLVTAVDVAAEEAIRRVIAAEYPEHAVLSEESASAQDFSALAHWTGWIVDPLDGTQNYVAGVPLSAVSVAYAQEGQPVVGVIYHPATGELFSALRGGGAWYGEKRLSVSERERLALPALLGSGFPRDMARRPELWHPFKTLTDQGIAVRRLGSAALSLAYVAAGRFDAYWDSKLAPWDVAAGLLLVEEAGGQVSDFAGQPYRWGGSVVLSNGHLHGQLLELTRLS